jgi:hypothetical protein
VRGERECSVAAIRFTTPARKSLQNPYNSLEIDSWSRRSPPRKCWSGLLRASRDDVVEGPFQTGGQEVAGSGLSVVRHTSMHNDFVAARFESAIRALHLPNAGVHAGQALEDVPFSFSGLLP